MLAGNRGRRLPPALVRSRQGCLSAQVLGEFFWVATRRQAPPLTAGEAVPTNYVRSWPAYPTTSHAVLEAVRAVRRYQFACWDALIWAIAKHNVVPTIPTEHQPSSNLIEGVRLVDPFDPGFDLDCLG